MEIIDADFATITQLEVLEALRSPPLSVYPSHQDWREALRAQKAGKPLPAPFEERTFRSMENICFVTAKTRQYLETQPAASQSYEGNHEFLQALDQALGKKDRLSVFEKQHFLDLRPTTVLECSRIIEECEERFTTAKLEELVELVKSKLPAPPEPPQQEMDEDTIEESANRVDDHALVAQNSSVP